MNQKIRERKAKWLINITKWIRAERSQQTKSHALDVRKELSWQNILTDMPADAVDIQSSNARSNRFFIPQLVPLPT